ncbi:hypothetical protein PH562_18910 [Rhizobium sp. CNPSo 4062]|nr:hypothetical protein [Rhizobium sp. CNPSo 4062]MDK4704331.1 hypothetical protein [Rhizobium sp. CNPSo 4062]
MIGRDIGSMTLWEFSCAVEGYRLANRTKDDPPPGMDDDRLAELGIDGF